MLKRHKTVLLLFGPPFLVNIPLFAYAYFFGESFEPPSYLAVYAIVSILPWLLLKTKILQTIVFSVISFVLCVLVGFGALLSTMFLPGSKEHNYIMYEVCFPAMKKYYGVGESDPFPTDGTVDKNGNSKWWVQHSECEDNVRAGKGPVFSDNPQDFVPVK